MRNKKGSLLLFDESINEKWKRIKTTSVCGVIRGKLQFIDEGAGVEVAWEDQGSRDIAVQISRKISLIENESRNF